MPVTHDRGLQGAFPSESPSPPVALLDIVDICISFPPWCLAVILVEAPEISLSLWDVQDNIAVPPVQPTLWMKLYAAGVLGPLFDWLHMLYARMSYVVRQSSDVMSTFKSLIGVLTGDTASPILWNIYFADLAAKFEEDANDVILDGVAISHLEQADDVVLFSTMAAGLQRKINVFFAWCKVNFMLVSVSKTQWMIFGPIPRHIPTMRIGDTIITLVKQYKFMGILFTSTERDICSVHYAKKVLKACAVANMTFAVKDCIGCLPPPQGIQLYMA
jgi:hypothetical protein